jgi:RNA polymerase sigma-70 factor (ECF subfamily)
LRWRVLPAAASGQQAFGHYIRDGASGRFLPHGVNVLTLRGSRICEITEFLTPEAFERFALPGRP